MALANCQKIKKPNINFVPPRPVLKKKSNPKAHRIMACPKKSNRILNLVTIGITLVVDRRKEKMENNLKV